VAALAHWYPPDPSTLTRNGAVGLRQALGNVVRASSNNPAYAVARDDLAAQRGTPGARLNLCAEPRRGDLRGRFVEAYERGGPITWSGRTLPAGDISYLHVAWSQDPVTPPPGQEHRVFVAAEDHNDASLADVTNEWITGPPGAAPEVVEPITSRRDPRRVMVVHGRNLGARDAVFQFLRSLSLQPIEWEQAVAETGLGSPHNLETVRAAMEVGQAVVVILTAEDQAGLLPSLAQEGDNDVLLRGQPRQNVVLEAGLAMGVDPRRTILVEIGPIRRASDFEGLNMVRLTNGVTPRAASRGRLRTAGCDVDDSGADWLSAESGGDFENAATPWDAADPERRRE
jgi:predicted nucleotide-binding protein